jgi:hypothetical protein
MTDLHSPGCCIVTGEPVFQVITVYPEGHPLAGRPLKIGAPLENALRATLVLLNGVATVTVAREMLDALSQELPNIWRRVLRTSLYEEENRLMLGGAPRSPEEARKHQEGLEKLLANIPIGVLCAVPWRDFLKG